MKDALFWLRWGGGVLWMNVAFMALFRSPTPLSSAWALPPPVLLMWASGFLLVLAAYWQAADLKLSLSRRRQWMALLLMAVLSIVLMLPGCTAQSLLLLLSAAVAPSVLPWRGVLGVISLQALSLAFGQWGQVTGETVVLNALLSWVVQGVVALLVRFATEERLGRQRLAELNVQLIVAQSKLEHASREAERLRIARELHDALGHHLTVLGLDLERLTMALQQPSNSNATSEVLKQARQTQQRLMVDARSVVGVLRTPHAGLLEFARELQGRVTQVRIHLNLPDELPPTVVPVEPVLMGLMQEGLTNTLRHAQARNIWMRLECCPGQVRLSVHDDGQAPAALCPGHGLQGLQERFSSAGGELQLSSRTGSLVLEGLLPLKGEPLW